MEMSGGRKERCLAKEHFGRGCPGWESGPGRLPGWRTSQHLGQGHLLGRPPILDLPAHLSSQRSGADSNRGAVTAGLRAPSDQKQTAVASGAPSTWPAMFGVLEA